MLDEDDRFARLGVLTTESKVSDVILALQGADAAYLCDYLTDAMRKLWDDNWLYAILSVTKDMVQDWCSQIGGRVALAGVYESDAMDEGCEIPPMMVNHMYSRKCFVDVRSEAWVAVRDQWCRDYAAFLKEFGL